MKSHLKIIAFATLAFSSQVLACRTDAVIISRSTSYGLSFGSGSSSFLGGLNREVQIPLRVGKKLGCMTQKSALDFEAKTNKRNEFQGEFNIFPPRVEFKKISGRVETFIKIDHVNSGSKIDQIKVSLASFTCTGESVIAVEGFEGSVRKAQELHNVSISQMIATGQVARMLAERRSQQMKIYGKTQILPSSLADYFLTQVEANPNLSLENIEREEVQRPSVFLSTSLATGAVDLDASFSTLTSTKYGCSKNFKSMMSRYHVSNIKKQLANLPFKANVSSKKIRLKWK